MKKANKIFKKNQIIITSLVIMIAVAGYLNYTDRNLQIPLLSKNADETADVTDISDEDNELANKSVDGDENAGEAVLTSGNVSESAIEGESTADADSGQPSSDNGSYIAKTRLNREQTRSKSKEMLQQIIDDENAGEKEKQEAMDKILDIASRMEKENTAESLLEAKGFGDCVIIIGDDSVDVIMDMSNVDNDQRAQIEDVVMSKTEMPLNKIVITPISEKK